MKKLCRGATRGRPSTITVGIVASIYRKGRAQVPPLQVRGKAEFSSELARFLSPTVREGLRRINFKDSLVAAMQIGVYRRASAVPFIAMTALLSVVTVFGAASDSRLA